MKNNLSTKIMNYYFKKGNLNKKSNKNEKLIFI